MIRKILRKNTYITLIRSVIYDHYVQDFIFGFVFKKQKHPRVVSLSGNSIKISTENVNDMMTINEVFGWEIYKTQRLNDYKIIFDLGANIGCASLFFGHKCKKLISIYAFEPDPRVKPVLDKNLKRLPARIKVKTYDSAISNKTGRAKLNRTVSSRYNTLNPTDQFASLDSITVNTLSIKDFISKIKHHDPQDILIKIDIEGIEQDVIKAIINEGYLGDIVYEGEFTPKNLGNYEIAWKRFNDVYYLRSRT